MKKTEGKGETEVRKAFEGILNQEDEKWKRILSNHDKNQVLGSRKRGDVFCIDSGKPDLPAFVIFTGEFKAAKNHLSNEDKGQVLTQALHLFSHQRNRKVVFTFLTNGWEIIYFKVVAKTVDFNPADENHFQYFQSKTFELDTEVEVKVGLQFLMHMMNADAADLGLPVPPEFEGLKANKFLGSGATSEVWLVETKNEELALKVYLKGQGGVLPVFFIIIISCYPAQILSP